MCVTPIFIPRLRWLRRSVFFLILGFAGLLMSITPVLAVDSSNAPERTNVSDVMASAEDVELRGIFEGVLPRTQRKNSLRLLVHPHFGDFHRKSYLRAPVGLRYGLTKNWDVAAMVEGYVSHGIDGVPAFEKYGISEFHVASKYRSRWSPFRGWEMAGRLRYSHPLDHPPVELVDGFEHVMPTITFARRLEGWPGVELFWGTGVDLVRRTHVAGKLEENEFGDDANILTAGMVWERGRRVYTLETNLATTSLIGTTDLYRFSIRPGIIFRLPSRFTFNSRGDWRMGMAVNLIYGPDGPDVGLSVKFRGNFDLKAWRNRHRDREVDARVR